MKNLLSELKEMLVNNITIITYSILILFIVFLVILNYNLNEKLDYRTIKYGNIETLYEMNNKLNIVNSNKTKLENNISKLNKAINKQFYFLNNNE